MIEEQLDRLPKIKVVKTPYDSVNNIVYVNIRLEWNGEDFGISVPVHIDKLKDYDCIDRFLKEECNG